jgi:hypothetical protein
LKYKNNIFISTSKILKDLNNKWKIESI